MCDLVWLGRSLRSGLRLTAGLSGGCAQVRPDPLGDLSIVGELAGSDHLAEVPADQAKGQILVAVSPHPVVDADAVKDLDGGFQVELGPVPSAASAWRNSSTSCALAL